MPKRWLISVCLLCAVSLSIPARSADITVVTWNTQRLSSPDAADTASSVQFEAAGRIMRALNADVYCLQELRAGTPDSALLLRDSYLTNYYVYLAENWPGDPDVFTMQAVVSRFPVRAATIVTNTNQLTGLTRELVRATLDVPGADQLTVFSAHLKSGTTTLEKAKREEEARQIADYIAALWSNDLRQPFLLCGDLNTDESVTGYGQALSILSAPGAGLRTTSAFDLLGNPETWIGDNTNLPRRFDYQLPNYRLTDTSSLVFRTSLGSIPPGLFSSDSTNASDHFPVWFSYAAGATQIQDRSRIILTEVDVFRSGAENISNEYVELFNVGSVAVDLSGWALDDLDGSVQSIASQSAVLLPGDYALVQQGLPSSSDSSSAGDGVLQLYIAAQLDFSASTDDQVVLIDVSGFPVDGVVYAKSDGVAAGELSDFNAISMLNWRYPQVTNDLQFDARSVQRSAACIARWRNEAGVYIDTDLNDDWLATDSRTPGSDNPRQIMPADLLITEIGVWQNTTALTQDFVEVFNQDSRTVDISGYIISDLDGTDTSTFSSVSALLLPGHYALVIFDTNGITETTSEPDGVLTVYYVKNTLRPSSTDAIGLFDDQTRIIDAVAWYDADSAVPSDNEIESDLASLCPEYWNYAPDPTNALMYKLYAVCASPDGGPTPPAHNQGISRFLFESFQNRYYDSNRSGDWYPAPVSAGSASDESIPEPAGFGCLLLAVLLVKYQKKSSRTLS